MTVKELYEYCKNYSAEDYEVIVEYKDDDGYFEDSIDKSIIKIIDEEESVIICY